MKPYRIAAAIALSLIAYAMTSCVTTETTTTAPDGTVTHLRVTAPAPGAAETASAIAGALASEVLAEK